MELKRDGFPKTKGEDLDAKKTTSKGGTTGLFTQGPAIGGEGRGSKQR